MPVPEPLNTLYVNLKLIFCVLAIVSATHVSAQRKILCRIIDKETNQPIKDAHIELEGTDTRTATNYLGFFELAIDSAHQILMITHPEFNPLRMVVPAEDKFKISLDRRTGQDDQSAEGNAFYMHVSRNLRYPQEARRAQVEGVVQVGFAIDDTGVPANITVLRNVGSGCGEEVVRVLKSLPPSLGQLLVSETSSKKFLLPVHFGLGKSQQSPQDPIHAEAGVFVLKVIDLTALGIERSGAPLQTSIRIVDEGAHETLSTALKNPKSAKKLSLSDLLKKKGK